MTHQGDLTAVDAAPLAADPLDSHTDTFVLKIELGNAVMLDHDDIARALAELSKTIHNGFPEASGRVRDDNGNVVGEWTIR